MSLKEDYDKFLREIYNLSVKAGDEAIKLSKGSGDSLNYGKLIGELQKNGHASSVKEDDDSYHISLSPEAISYLSKL